MTEQDLFFTQSIVGSPTVATLGRPLAKKELRQQGTPQAHRVARALPAGGVVLLWNNWCVIGDTASGRPRHQPGRLRRALERYSLVLAVLALLMLAASLAISVGWLPAPAAALALPGR